MKEKEKLVKYYRIYRNYFDYVSCCDYLFSTKRSAKRYLSAMSPSQRKYCVIVPIVIAVLPDPFSDKFIKIPDNV